MLSFTNAQVFTRNGETDVTAFTVFEDRPSRDGACTGPAATGARHPGAPDRVSGREPWSRGGRVRPLGETCNH